MIRTEITQTCGWIVLMGHKYFSQESGNTYHIQFDKFILNTKPRRTAVHFDELIFFKYQSIWGSQEASDMFTTEPYLETSAPRE